MNDETHPGGCSCSSVRYQVIGAPMFVNCCHCRWCQQESGTAFALNALIEADRVEVLAGAPEATATPSESGKGQTMWRCPECGITLWSNYGGAGDALHFIRVGTLDNPDALPPDMHSFTSTKQPWLNIDDGRPQVPGSYDRKEFWPQESLDRLRALISNSA